MGQTQSPKQAAFSAQLSMWWALLLLSVLLQGPQQAVGAYSCSTCSAISGAGTEASPFTLNADCLKADGKCLLALYKDRNGANANPTCSANDISLASLVAINTDSCEAGKTQTFIFRASIDTQANARQDVGFYINLEGTGASAFDGTTCLDVQLPRNCSGTASGARCTDLVGDEDCCGDVGDYGTDKLWVILPSITTVCKKPANGTTLELPYCAAYDNNQNSKTCSGFGGTGNAVLVADQPSKCRCSSVSTNVKIASLSITKTVNGSSSISVGAANTTVQFDVTVTNTGTANLTGVVLTDVFAGATGVVGTPVLDTSTDKNNDKILGVSEVWKYKLTYVVAQADIDNGVALVNTATVTTDQTAAASDKASVNMAGVATLTVTKSANPTSVSLANTPVIYTYTISNTGTKTLTGVTLKDDNFTPTNTADDIILTNTNKTGDVNSNNKLDVGETWTYTLKYTVTQSDIDKGGVLTNVATASSTQTGSQTATAAVTLGGSKSLTITKKAVPATVDTANTSVTFTVTITNTGTTTLTNVVVKDNNFSGSPFSGTALPTANRTGDTNADNKLDVGESWVYKYTYVVSQANIDSGTPLVNTAGVTTAENVNGTANATITIVQIPGMTVKKVANPTSVTSAPTVVTYTYNVTNTGKVTLSNVTLRDDAFTPSVSTDDIYFSSSNISSGDNGNKKLDVGETWTFKTTYTVTQDDIDNKAALTNVVYAAGTQPVAAGPYNDSATVSLNGSAAIEVKKYANVSVVTQAGTAIRYTYYVKNNGNVSLTSITIVDDMWTPANTADDKVPTFVTASDTNGNGKLDVKTETWQYTLDVVITQGQIDAGDALVNTVTADSAQTDPVTDTFTVNVTQVPGLSFTKSADVSSVAHAGDVITYTYTLDNTGFVTLTGVSIIDDNFTSTRPDFDVTTLAGVTFTGDADKDGKLDVTETWVYTWNYTVTQADIDNGGFLVNSAKAITDQVNQTSSVNVTVVQDPRMALVKAADGVSSVSAVDDVITYTYTLSNTGTVTLHNITLTDDGFSNQTSYTVTPVIVDKGNNDTSLDVGETWTYTYSYTVTQADIDNGGNYRAAGKDYLRNWAKATSDETEAVGLTVEDYEDVQVAPNPGIQVTKEADLAQVSRAGQTIVYTIRAENTGTVSLSSVTVTDVLKSPVVLTAADLSDFPDIKTVGKLDVGETWTFKVSYNVTQADIHANVPLVNTIAVTSNLANATGDNVTVTIDQQPSIAVTLTANCSEVNAVGQVIEYTYVVKNTGLVTLTSIKLYDDNFNASTPQAIDLSSTTYVSSLTGSSDDGKLSPDEEFTFTHLYTVTQADLDSAASLVNQALAKGTVAATGTVVDDTDYVSVTVSASAAMAVTKVADPTSVTAANETVTFTITVSNTGTQTLKNVTVVDNGVKAGATPQTLTRVTTDANGFLDVGESWEYTYTYVTTQADIDANVTLNNTLTVDSNKVKDKTAFAEVAVLGDPQLIFDKTVNPETVKKGNTTVTFTYKLTNNGTVTLKNITLKDFGFTAGAADDFTFSNTDATKSKNSDNDLDVGETWTFTSTYTVSQAQVDAGEALTNTATVSSGQTPNQTDTATVSFSGQPAVEIKKYADVGQVSQANDSIVYTANVSNTGDVTLTDVVVTDPRATPTTLTLASGDSKNLGKLDVDEVWTYTFTYLVTQDEIDAQLPLLNVATVSTNQTTDKKANVTVTVNTITDVTFTKTANVSLVSAVGTVIGYDIVADNTGYTTLTNLTVTDKGNTLALASGDTNRNGKLDWNETWHYSYQYTVTQADINAGGNISNIAILTVNEIPNVPPATVTVPISGIVKKLTVTKSANPTQVSAVGDQITYTYTLANEGQVTLTNITLVDDNHTPGNTADDVTLTNFPYTGDANGNGALDPAETWTYSWKYNVTQTDLSVAGGLLTNVAVASSKQTGSVNTSATVTIKTAPNACPYPKPIQSVSGTGCKSVTSCTSVLGLSNCCLYPESKFGYCSDSSAYNCPDGSKFICNGGGNRGAGNCGPTVFCDYVNPNCRKEFKDNMDGTNKGKKENIHCWGQVSCRDSAGKSVACPTGIPAGAFCYEDGASGPNKPGDNFKVCCSLAPAKFDVVYAPPKTTTVVTNVSKTLSIVTGRRLFRQQ